MLSKRSAYQMIKLLSDEEFKFILFLLSLPMDEFKIYLKESKCYPQHVCLVMHWIVKDLQDGGCWLLDAIWERLPD